MRPVFYLFSVDGADITASLMDRTTRLTVTDEEGVTSDTLEVELDDRGQRIQLPAIGDRLRLVLGYLERTPIPTIGDFVVDEVRLSGPPLTIGFAAKGADMVRTAIKAPVMIDAPDATLADVARRIAQRHGFEPRIHPQAEAVPIGHIVQQTESDMALLTRLARAHDFVARIDGQRLTLRPHAGNLPPARQPDGLTPPLHRLRAQDITRYDYTINARSRYGRVRAWYYDADRGRRVPVEVEDGEHADAPTMELRHDARTEQQARAQAEARLRQLRRAGGTLTLETPGDTRLLAGHHVYLTGLAQPVGGQWVIQRAEHTLDAAGLRTRLECVPPGERAKVSNETVQSLVEEVE